MTFGLTIEKLIMIAFIAAMVIGPTRLPDYAAALARTVRRTKEFVRDTTDRVKADLGPEVDDVDWRSLDPRRYDPRRIVRQALWDDEETEGPPGVSTTGRRPEGHDIPEPAAIEYVPRRFPREHLSMDAAALPPAEAVPRPPDH
jgi:sec-independent protein translocase protein TatB